MATPDYIQFDISATNTTAVGKLYWDAGEGSFLYTLSGGNVTQNLHPGSELVYNGTGSSLTKGQVVYLSGAQGQRPSVALALATSDTTSARTIGIVAETIANGAEGWIRTIGILEGFDTSAFTEGAQLYLSGTTAGAMTATKPVAPTHLVYTARVIKSHATAGRILVGIQNGYELDEIHDVLVTSPVDNEVLTYNTASGLWKNESIVSALGYTPANKAGDTFSGAITVNSGSHQAVIAADGAIELTRSGGGAYIDFKDVTSEDFDSRIQQSGTGFALTGTVSAGSDFRAPIFYDSNDTGYYLNPNSSSNLYTVTVASQLFVNGDARAPIFYDSDNTGYYVNPAGTSYVSGEFQVQQSGISGLRIISGTGTQSLWVRAGYDTDGTGTPASSPYNIEFQSSGSSGGSFTFVSGNTKALTITSDYAQGAGSLRAPIFYDSDNTGYYVDPASTSVLNTVNALVGISAYDGGVVGGDAYGMISVTRRTDGNYSYYGLTRASNHAMGMGIDTFNTFWIGGCTAGFNGTRSSTWLAINPSGNVTAPVDMRAPIYYDSNDTGYYVDPNGDSRLSGNLNLGSFSNIRFGGTSYAAGVVTLEGGYNNGFYIYPTGSTNGITFGVVGAYSYATNSFRAPIFYDQNDTGYYLDPNGTSNLYRTSTYLAGKYVTSDWADGFRNTPTQSYNFHGDVSSGGPSGTWWFYESMRHSNSANYWGTQIAWGWEDNANRLLQRNVTSNSFSGWVEYLNTSDRTYNGNLYMTGSIRSTSSDIRAPIFYDQDNTGYYVNPNGSSYVSGTWTVAGAVSASASITSTNSMYSPIYYDNDNSGYYIDAASTSNIWRINANEYRNASTVLRTAANANWLSMYFDASGADKFHFASDGNLWVGLWGAWVSDQWRSSIYYDYNDTTYYCNPNGESVLNTLTLFGELNLSASGINYIDHSGTIYFRNQSGYATSATLTTGGDFTASGNVTAYSDARLKDNVETVSNALDLVSAMRGVTYTRKDTGSEGIGVIAQEMQEIVPQVVQQSKDGTLSVAYGNLVGVLIEAIKDQQSQITAIEAKVEAILAKLK